MTFNDFTNMKTNLKKVKLKDMKSTKLILYEYFKNINKSRYINKFNALLLITLSFLQLYYLINELTIVNSLHPEILLDNKMVRVDICHYNFSYDNITYSDNNTEFFNEYYYINDIKTNVSQGSVFNYKEYQDITELNIFDTVSIAMKFSVLIPLLEYKQNIFLEFYIIIYIAIYMFTFTIIVISIYFIKRIVNNKEILSKILLDYISSSFLFLQWIFYIPILYVLLYFTFGKQACILFDSNSLINLPMKIINIIISVFYIFLNFFISKLNNDSINKYDNYLCRSICNIETLLFYLRTILVFLLVLNIPYTISLIIIFFTCILIAFMIYSFYSYKFYNDETIEIIYCSFLLCYIQKVIGILIYILSEKNYMDYSLTIIFCFIVNYNIFKIISLQIRKIILKKRIIDLDSNQEILLFIDVLEKEISNSLIGDPMSSSIITGFIINHKTTCIKETCPLNSLDLFYPLTNISHEIVSNKIQEVFKNEIILIHLLKEIYSILKAKLHDNCKFNFSYSLFLLYRLGNVNLSLIEIENSMNLECSLQEEYSFYILKDYANEILLNSQNYISSEYTKHNITINDILDVIVFDELINKIQVEIINCSRLKIEFWSILKLNKIYIEDLYEKANLYINKKNDITKIWKRIQLISSNNKKINDLYMKYQEYICDDLTFAIVDNSKKTSQSNNINISDIVFSRFNDDTGFIIVDMNKETIGNINYYNKIINKILGFQSEFLYLKNICTIIPDSIGDNHNDIMNNFIQTGKNKSIGKNKDLFVKDKDNFIKPISLFLMPMPSYNSKSEIIGLIKERNSLSSAYYILINDYGIIDSISKEFNSYDEFLDPQILNKLNFEIFVFFIFPELLLPNRLFFNDRSETTFSIKGYFDISTIPILSELDDSIKENKIMIKMKRKEKMMKILNYFKGNFPEETQKKINVFANFFELCQEVKKGLINKSKYSIDAIQQIRNYINYMENICADGKIKDKNQNNFNQIHNLKPPSKKNFNIKVSSIKYSTKDFQYKRLYVLEITIPPLELDNDKVSSINNNSDDHVVDNDKGNIHDNNNYLQADDIGSMSMSSSNSLNSINNIVLKIREESFGTDLIDKSSFINYMMIFLLLIIFLYIVYFNIYIYQTTTQQNLKIDLINKHFLLKRSIYEYRDNVIFINYTLKRYTSNNIYNINNFSSFIDNNQSSLMNNFYSQSKLINIRMIKSSLELFILKRDIFDILLKISDKEIKAIINLLKYDKYTYTNDIINTLIYLSGIISYPYKEYINDTLINSYLINLNINNTYSINNSTYDDIKYQETELNHNLNLFLIYSGDKFQSLIFLIINQLQDNSNNDNINLTNFLYYSYIGIFLILLIVFVLKFYILKQRYIQNQTVLELLNSLKNEEIDEILLKVEDFLIISNLEEKRKKEKYSCKDLIDLQSEVNFGLIDENEWELNKKQKVMIRKKSIMLIFFINISLISIIIIIFLFTLWMIIDIHIGYYKFTLGYTIKTLNSSIYNQKVINNIHSIIETNDTDIYNGNSELINNLNNSKILNEEIFREFSENKEIFFNKTANDIDLLFYSNICSDTYKNLINISNCIVDKGNTNSKSEFSNQIDLKPVLKKGFKYLTVYFTYLIDNIVLNFNNLKENYQIYQNFYIDFLNKESFYEISMELNNNQMKIIYTFIVDRLMNSFYNISSNFIMTSLISSCVFIILEVVVIILRWKKYIQQIKIEEYTSNKIIAEVPMYIIKQNKEICEHMLNYSNTNS